MYPSVKSGNFDRYERFPGSWSQYQDGRPRYGYASYAVSIEGLDPHAEYAFRFPAYSSAVRYYIDGAELYSQGYPANNGASERVRWTTALVPLPGSGDSGGAGRTGVVLVMHLSNFYDIYPGGTLPIRFGGLTEVSRQRSLHRLFLIIPFGALLAMGVYFIALFLYSPKEKASLWLGLLSFLFALRISCYDEFFCSILFPRCRTRFSSVGIYDVRPGTRGLRGLCPLLYPFWSAGKSLPWWSPFPSCTARFQPFCRCPRRPASFRFFKFFYYKRVVDNPDHVSGNSLEA